MPGPRTHPLRRLTLTAIGIAVAGAGVVLARNEGFRGQVVGSAKALGEEIAGSERGGTAG